MNIDEMTDAELLKVLREWHGSEQKFYQDSLQMAQGYYETARRSINKKDLHVLDEAITSGYLNAHGLSTKVAGSLMRAYKHYCSAHGLPTITILPSKRKHLAKVTLDLDSLHPCGQHSLYAPFLDPQAEPFHTFMLLASEYTWSSGTSGHINIDLIHIANAEEVARRLLAFYNDLYQRQKERIDSLMATMKVKE